MVVGVCVFKCVPYLPVGDNGVGHIQSVGVEGLTGRVDGSAVCRGLRVQGYERNVPYALEQDIAVGLVADHKHVIAVADFRHPLHVLPAPRVGDGVVGIAEDQHGGSGVGCLSLQVLKIDAVGSIFVNQRIFQDISSVALDDQRKVKIHRRLDNHVVAHVGDRLHEHLDRNDQARRVGHPVRPDFSAVPLFIPVGNRIVKCLGHNPIRKIALDRLFHHRFRHLGRRQKIRIRHAQGIGAFLTFLVPFPAVGSLHVFLPFKIICSHHIYLLCLCRSHFPCAFKDLP